MSVTAVSEVEGDATHGRTHLQFQPADTYMHQGYSQDKHTRIPPRDTKPPKTCANAHANTGCTYTTQTTTHARNFASMHTPPVHTQTKQCVAM